MVGEPLDREVRRRNETYAPTRTFNTDKSALSSSHHRPSLSRRHSFLRCAPTPKRSHAESADGVAAVAGLRDSGSGVDDGTDKNLAGTHPCILRRLYCF